MYRSMASGRVKKRTLRDTSEVVMWMRCVLWKRLQIESLWGSAGFGYFVVMSCIKVWVGHSDLPCLCLIILCGRRVGLNLSSPKIRSKWLRYDICILNCNVQKLQQLANNDELNRSWWLLYQNGTIDGELLYINNLERTLSRPGHQFTQIWIANVKMD